MKAFGFVSATKRTLLTSFFTSSVILKQVFVCHVSLRLGHRTALTLSTSFTTVLPLRFSLRLMFAVRIVLCTNFKVCGKLEVYLRTWQYTASGMHTRGLTVHRTVIQYLRAASLLAAARSQNGSDVINVIHYRSAVSLPQGEG